MKAVQKSTQNTVVITQRCPETESITSDEGARIDQEHQIDSIVNDSRAADAIRTNLNLKRDSTKTLRQSSIMVGRLDFNTRRSKCDDATGQKDNSLQTRLHKNLLPPGLLFASNSHSDSNMGTRDVVTMKTSKSTIRKRKKIIAFDA